jgi:hypothetical protein
MPALFGDRLLPRLVFSTFTAVYGAAHVASNLLSRLLPQTAKLQPEFLPGAKNKLGEPMFPQKLDIATEWTTAHTEAINEWNRKSHDDLGCWTPRKIFCKNVSFIPNLINGKIAIDDSGIERIEGRRVHFKNRDSQHFDAIVLCTGFAKDFSVFGPDIRIKDNNVRNLYRHAIHPDHSGRLVFIGQVRPFSGGIPVCSEMQARYFAQICSKKVTLPKDIRKRIEVEKKWEDELTSMSPRHAESIPSQIFFLDSIAKEIGCLVPMRELILNPRLLVRLWFYPFNQGCYRLRGPHSNHDEAWRECMSETQGPVSTDAAILTWVVLSLLPSTVHPKDTVIRAPAE